MSLFMDHDYAHSSLLRSFHFAYAKNPTATLWRNEEGKKATDKAKSLCSQTR